MTLSMNKVHREPDFENIKKVLECKKPDRPTLFEFFMNPNVYEYVAGKMPPAGSDSLTQLIYMAKAYAACGYDYVNAYGCDLEFPTMEREAKSTISINAHALITDRESFEKYPWPDAKNKDYSVLEKINGHLPGKMKLMTAGPGGLLENVIRIVGYDNLCMMIYDDPELVKDIFDKAGSILLDYYENCAKYDSVGILMINDDWGFNTQTMLSPNDMRKYVFPWHKKMVEAAHKNGKFAVLHSCGYMGEIMEDIIEDMKYDGRHSYEDNIIPVEEAYERWGGRIAILGGIDVDFLIRSSDEDIRQRAKNMLSHAAEKGGYALGSGNSIPEYIPNEKYFAMTSAVSEI